MCMSDKSCDAWPDAIADDDVSLLWFDAKSSFLPKNCSKLLYQRTTGSSKRITMCSTNIPARTQVQLINSGGAQITYIEQHRLFNQIRQQESYCSEAPSGQSRPASYLAYSQETASAPFMNIDTKMAASPEPSTHAADFAQRVRVNQAKLTSELRLHYVRRPELLLT